MLKKPLTIQYPFLIKTLKQTETDGFLKNDYNTHTHTHTHTQPP